MDHTTFTAVQWNLSSPLLCGSGAGATGGAAFGSAMLDAHN